MVEPHSSNFRVITTNVLGVRIFRKFTVVIYLKRGCEFGRLTRLLLLKLLLLKLSENIDGQLSIDFMSVFLFQIQKN